MKDKGGAETMATIRKKTKSLKGRAETLTAIGKKKEESRCWLKKEERKRESLERNKMRKEE